ncbi:MAG TPA: hypothetical protein VH540_12245 [Ktedonobacterales bacterium]|jgi:hypothetical protein
MLTGQANARGKSERCCSQQQEEAASAALAAQEQDRWPGPPVPSTIGTGMLFRLCHRSLSGIGCTKSLLAEIASAQDIPGFVLR